MFRALEKSCLENPGPTETTLSSVRDFHPPGWILCMKTHLNGIGVTHTLVLSRRRITHFLNRTEAVVTRFIATFPHGGLHQPTQMTAFRAVMETAALAGITEAERAESIGRLLLLLDVPDFTSGRIAALTIDALLEQGAPTGESGSALLRCLPAVLQERIDTPTNGARNLYQRTALDESGGLPAPGMDTRLRVWTEGIPPKFPRSEVLVSCFSARPRTHARGAVSATSTRSRQR